MKTIQTYSDAGGIQLGTAEAHIIVGNGYGDGRTRVIIDDNGEAWSTISKDDCDFVTIVDGSSIEIPDYDCPRTTPWSDGTVHDWTPVVTLDGRYSIYTYSAPCGGFGTIIFEREGDATKVRETWRKFTMAADSKLPTDNVAATETPVEAPENVTIHEYPYSYNERRYGKPWVGRMDAQGNFDFSDEVGIFTGKAGSPGKLVIYRPVKGQVYCYGQKDYRGHSSETDFARWDGEKFEDCDRLGNVL